MLQGMTKGKRWGYTPDEVLRKTGGGVGGGEGGLVDSLVRGPFGFWGFWFSLRISGRPEGLDRRNDDHDVINKDPYVLLVRYFYPALPVALLNDYVLLTAGIELFVKRLWYRTLARIHQVCSANASPEISAPHSSPAARLPREVVEEIVSHLVSHPPSLLACTLTCYSWYIAAAPYLHRILITPIYFSDGGSGFFWGRPLRRIHKFGLLPLVNKFQVLESRRRHEFSPRRLDSRTLRQFSALTNVQELGIDRLNIPEFMPSIRRYFGHFLPTLRSLTLREPKGSRRQVIYFIGLFQHLEDLKLLHDAVGFEEEPTGDLTLIPPFAPPLRGSLMMTCYTKVGFLKDMIDLLGGIRFRHMDLYRVAGMRHLLGACAETLETLRLYPDHNRKEALPVVSLVFADNLPVGFFPDDIGLSQNRSLRVLKVAASSIVGGEPGFLARMLSTITSPAFSEVVVFYRDHDFRGVNNGWNSRWNPFSPMFENDIAEEAWSRHRQFEAIREMRKARDFRLVLWVDVWDRVGEYSVQVLKRAVELKGMEVGFENLFPEPFLVYTPRRFGPEFLEDFAPGDRCSWLPQ